MSKIPLSVDLAALRQEAQAHLPVSDTWVTVNARQLIALIEAFEAMRDEVTFCAAMERTPTQRPGLYAKRRERWSEARARKERAFEACDFGPPADIDAVREQAKAS